MRTSFLAVLFFLYISITATYSQTYNYNVEWTTPSYNESGSMPLGNGVTAANVWYQPQNDRLSLYVARQDAWDENANLLKLNRLDIAFTPSLQPLLRFNQTLDLRTATIYLELSGTHLSLSITAWIDANADHVVVQVASPEGTAFGLTVTSSTWRTQVARDSSGSWYCDDRYTYPDVVVETLPGDFINNSVVVYHRNDMAIDDYYAQTLKRQGLESVINEVTNPVNNRQFGSVVYGSEGLVRTSPTTLQAKAEAHQYVVVETTHTSVTPTANNWMSEVNAKVLDLQQLDAHRTAHLKWWESFWERSHITITDAATVEDVSGAAESEGGGGGGAVAASDAFVVTQKYGLWRYLQACQARSTYPIKFNGQLYVCEEDVNPDHRGWGSANWWQNARLPYYNMFVSGDHDLLPSLFEYYLSMLPLALQRSPIYFNITGAFWPETQLIFGTYYDSDYGCTRTIYPVGIPDTRWNRYNYQGGLDVSAMILDYYTYTQDLSMLNHYLPIITSVVEFYSQRWTSLDPSGKIIFYPSQAIETWQCTTYPPVETDCVTNDAPDIAGLIAVLNRLLKLPAGTLSQSFVTLVKTFLSRLPPLPTGKAPNGETVYVGGSNLPAHTSNDENPELYVLHPYHIVTQDTHAIALASYNNRRFRYNEGWCQDLMNAALLGLVNETRDMVVQRAQSPPSPGYRFAGFMPAFQDYQPSVDHLANMNTALQWMILQGDEEDNILLFPAWPCKEWDLDFKLWGPLNTVVEGRLVAGKVTNLVVTPSSRAKDVKLAGCA